MIYNKILWKKLNKKAIQPHKEYIMADLGYDMHSLNDYTLLPNTTTKIYTGIACKLPKGFGAFIKDRSSVASKKQLFVVGGVIDNSYTGELIIVLHNASNIDAQYINAKDKIAQLVIIPLYNFENEVVDDFEVDNDARGNAGFGSSDNK